MNNLHQSRSAVQSPVRRSFLRFLGYLAAAILPALLVGLAVALTRFLSLAVSQPPDYQGTLPAVVAPDPARPTAVILVSNLGTENTDFLAPYEILAKSGAFNLYVVAPERRLSALTSMPTFSEGVDILPDLSFADYERVMGGDPDLIVIPNFPYLDHAENQPILTWIRDHAGPQTTLLTICAGAEVLAKTGLMDGHKATTHHGLLTNAPKQYPHVEWVNDQRWVEDGRIISSAGVTGGIDATLYTVGKLVGMDVARAIAASLDYPHIRFLEDPTYDLPPASMAVSVFTMAYHWPKQTIGFYLYDGVDELAIASITDSYPFTTKVTTVGIAAKPGIVRSKHGLHLVPRWTFAKAPRLSRMLIPAGDLSEADAEAIVQWGDQVGIEPEAIHQPTFLEGGKGSRFVFDMVLADMDRHYDKATLKVVINGIEYPFGYENLQGQAWPIAVFLTPLLIGLTSLALFSIVQRRRTMNLAPTGSSGTPGSWPARASVS